MTTANPVQTSEIINLGRLKSLGILSPEFVPFLLPRKYLDLRDDQLITNFIDLPAGEKCTLYGICQSLVQIIFGVNGGMAESFANMDIEIIRRISNAGILCFEPRMTPEFAAKMAALDASEIDIFLNIIGGMEVIYET